MDGFGGETGKIQTMRRGMAVRVKQLKRERRISYAQMGTTCGMSVDTIRRLARGDSAFHLNTLFMFCEKMGISADWLIWGENRKAAA